MSMKIASVLIFVFLNTQIVFACMCGHSSVDDAFLQANAVVKATVEKVENAESDESSQSVILRVEKSYKGTADKTITLVQKRTTCDWWFESKNIGKQFLFYLAKDKSKNIFGVIACGRSTEISSANDDLSWLDGLPSSLKRTRISGTTSLSANDFPPLANVELEIIGKNRKYKVTTDRNGLYEIWDVPAGVYSVLPTIPSSFILGWTTSIPTDWTYFWDVDAPDKEALKFVIKPKKCGGVDFMFKRKNDEK